MRSIFFFHPLIICKWKFPGIVVKICGAHIYIWTYTVIYFFISLLRYEDVNNSGQRDHDSLILLHVRR